MHRLWIFTVSMLKYSILPLIVVLVINHFYPKISIIVFIFSIIGSFGVTSYGFKERYNRVLEKREQRRILRVAEESRYEFEGFDQAIKLTREKMN